jgi:hypothetical protein
LRTRLLLTATACAAVLGCGLVAAGPASATASFQLTGTVAVHPVRPDFLGLALEYRSIPVYTGPSGQPVNPLLLQLVRGLDPGGRPLLRIGGQSGDRTWWPVPGMRRPLGITYDLSDRWMASARALTEALQARLILGVGLEADVPRIAQVEVRQLESGLGRAAIAAIELGNEPELYRVVPWYRTLRGHPVPWYDAAGAPVYARGPDWSPSAFVADYSRTKRLLPPLPLAGPSTGSLPLLSAFSRAFLSPTSQLRVLTWHAYGLDNCVTDPATPQYPSVPHLLSTAAAAGWSAGIGPYVALAHHDRAGFVLDETGSVSCNGHPGVSNTFASALWVLGMLFTAADDGIDNVELHTYPGLSNDLFDFARSSTGAWRAMVRPLYYGALLFAQAAPAGSKLLHLAARDPGSVRAWAAELPDGSIHVLMINVGLRRGTRIVLAGAPARGGATVIRLQAPSAYATSGVRLGGQTFGSSTSSGTLPPAAAAPVSPAGDAYALTLPPSSAALLSVPGS